jgi:hypothetical protein
VGGAKGVVVARRATVSPLVAANAPEEYRSAAQQRCSSASCRSSSSLACGLLAAPRHTWTRLAREWLNALKGLLSLLVSVVAAICFVLFADFISAVVPTHALRVAAAGTAPRRRPAHQAAQPSASAGRPGARPLAPASRTSSSMSLR